ncbi:DUF3326 domain-containing protein [Streptomyces albidoflavus]
MITNRRHELDRSDITGAAELLERIETAFDEPALRWYISEADQDRVVVESTEYGGELLRTAPRRNPVRSGKDVIVSLVPTGIGCSIGGYAGDAAPATALLAEVADLVVTNPNAVNASNFIRIDERVLYTEGSCIDAFSRGKTNLHRARGNRVGLIIEKSDAASVEHILNVTNAVRAVHGVDVVDYVVTEEPIGSRCVRNVSGAYVGSVDSPDVLLKASRQLIERGANAIAVTTNVQDLVTDDYSAHFSGNEANPVGGVEAIISHLIVKVLGVPAAHAPMMNFKDLALDQAVVDARSAGEIVSTSGLACILIGLAGAPQMRSDIGGARLSDELTMDDVVAVVAPAGALGGVPVLEALSRRIPVIAVRGNDTILDVTADRLGLPGVVEVSTYPEAAGMITALRAGISLDSLVRPMRTLGRSE